MRLVCPYCLSDEQLYSIETAALMYPVRVQDGEFYHTGEEYIVADDTTFEGRIYCRADDEDLRPAELLMTGDCCECGRPVFRRQDAARPRFGDGVIAWRDLRGSTLCPDHLTPHRVGE